MRHGDKQNNLGRKKAHREALLMNLACQLIMHKRIVTTLAKAKALRTYFEPLATKTKKTGSKDIISHNHRIVFSYLNDKSAVKELFTVVAPKIATRPGGYTRIIKLGIRPGDNALSPGRIPNLMIRVYPPGRVAIFGATTVNNSFTADLSFK
jgi:large subunit ribosomal protein L17